MSSKPRSRVTSRDIAREAGVSQPTVSRALRGDPRVAEATVTLVRETAHRLGYVPHAAARSLTTNRTATIAVVIADITNPFYPELVQELHLELERSGYHAVLINERTSVNPNGAAAELLGSGVVDGAIVATATIDEHTREMLDREPSPIVLIVRDVPGCGRDVVVADNRGGAAQAARHLVELGHRRIGSIAGPDDTSTARERRIGFAEGLERSGVRIEHLERSGEYTHQSGYQWCLDMLALPEPPTAIFCGNDVIALGALDAARRRSVDVPGDLSIVGFDDIDLAASELLRLTTVRQPLPEMAHEAVRLVLRRIEQQATDDPRHVVFPTEFVQRGTSGAPRAPE